MRQEKQAGGRKPPCPAPWPLKAGPDSVVGRLYQLLRQRGGRGVTQVELIYDWGQANYCTSVMRRVRDLRAQLPLGYRAIVRRSEKAKHPGRTRTYRYWLYEYAPGEARERTE